MPRRFRYVFIFPPDLVFEETKACYRSAATRLDWISVDDLSAWSPERPEWQDPGVCLVFWGRHPKMPDRRAAKCAMRYTESAGPGLIPNQQAEMEGMKQLGMAPDMVFAGTPATKAILDPWCRKVAVAPIGYDAAVMDIPCWNTSKGHDFGFYGTMVGRRKRILPILKKRFGPQLSILHEFGKARKSFLDRCRAILYVGHSEEPGFPGMRLWQAIATSAALVTEKRDAWPAVSGRHYVEVAPAREEDPQAFIASLENALKYPLESIARTAHKELSLYTIERCIEDFVVPAMEGLP